MGLSSPNLPNANLTKTITINYTEIAKLCKKNKEYSKLVINYKKLDEITVNLLRQVIANIAHNYSYPSIEKESVRNELKNIFVLNMSDVVEIDYEKLADHEEDEGVDFALILRNSIQSVLDERKKKVYNNMILNPTV